MEQRVINIAIVGAGQIGSRHLQSLATLARPARIQVIDPEPEHLGRARARFDETAEAEHFPGRLELATDLASLASELDVAIIATGSIPRRRIVEELTAKKRVRHFVLEKFLFPRMEDYAAVGRQLADSGAEAWVNCPLRMYPVYQEIRRRVQDERKLNFHYQASAWPIGSNAIHFLDLFSYLTGDLDFRVRCDGLGREVRPSKREGYIDFSGRLDGESSRCRFTLASLDTDHGPAELQIRTSDRAFVIRGGRNASVIETELRTGKTIACREVAHPLQSQLTAKVVGDLTEGDGCELTPYAESATLHQLLLEAFMGVLSQATGRQANECAVT